MVVYLSLVIAILGAVLYMLAPNEKVRALSIWGFGVGLLVFLMHAQYLTGLPK